MPETVLALREKYDKHIQWVEGAEDNLVEGLNAPELASTNQMVFISDAQHLLKAKSGKSKIWVVKNALLESARASASPEHSIFSSQNPQLAMTVIARQSFPVLLNKAAFDGHNIHPSAVISSSATLGQNVLIGPHVTIGDMTIIGDDCIIGANTTIEANVKIGKASHIHPQVFIGHSTEIGDRCEIHPQTTIASEGFGYAHDQQGRHHRITHYGKVLLENDVHIGAGVQIDRGTFGNSRIGEGTKIDNHCHFGHNINLGRHNLITGGFIAAGSTTIGDHCVFGGRCTVTGHIHITNHVQISGLSGVAKSIDKPGAYGGFPLQELQNSIKTRASLLHLAEMRKNINRILKKLNVSENLAEEATRNEQDRK